MSRLEELERVMGDRLKIATDAMQDYCEAYVRYFGDPVGDDDVLGPETAAVLAGLRGLLKGPTGRLDCGTADGLLIAIATQHGLLDVNGELTGDVK